MRIAIVSNIPVFPTSGGNRARILAMTRALAAAGHAVHFVLLPSRSMAATTDIAAHRAAFGAALTVLPRGGPAERLYLVRRALSGLRRRVSGWAGSTARYAYGLDELHYPPFGRMLRALCEQARFDAVIVQYVYNSALLDAVPEGVLRILDTHDRFGERYRLFADTPQTVPFISLTLDAEEAGFRRADHVIAIQEEEAAGFRARLGRDAARVHVVSHLVDLSAPVDVAARDERASFIGSAFDANIEALTYFIEQVLPRILLLQPGFRLVVAGTIGDAVPAHPAVDRLGFVPRPGDAFARGPVAINPIRTGTGINIKLLDAMAAGVPVVSTRTGVRGLGAAHHAGVAIVADDDPDAFARAVAGLTADAAARVAAGAAAHASARAWNAVQTDALARVLRRDAAAGPAA